MKFFVAFAFCLFVSSSFGNLIKVFKNIDDYKTLNPGVKLIELDVTEHELDSSRSYSIGGRQTGK